MQRIIEETLERIPSQPYPELRLALETFVGGVQDAIKANFVGAYLVGSLATGDFDHDSDVDFLVVTDDELTDVQVQSLQALHLESLTMSAVSSSFLRTLLYALIEERHFALVDGLRFPTLGSL